MKSLLLLLCLLPLASIHADETDTRQPIVLTDSERNLILAEMRTFLQTVQAITGALAQNDLATVADSARKAGRAAQQAMPAGLAQKLPLPFRQLGSDTHRRFDQLALNARDLEDTQLALEELARLLQNCTACHDSYRLERYTD